MVKKKYVPFEELAEMARRLIQSMKAKKLAHEAHIRAAGEFHPFRAVVEVEFRGESPGKRRRARPAGVDERAIDIK